MRIRINSKQVGRTRVRMHMQRVQCDTSFSLMSYRRLGHNIHTHENDVHLIASCDEVVVWI